jgi:hypothetical protein
MWPVGVPGVYQESRSVSAVQRGLVVPHHDAAVHEAEIGQERKLSNLSKRGFERPDLIPYATFAMQGSGLIASTLPVG